MTKTLFKMKSTLALLSLFVVGGMPRRTNALVVVSKQGENRDANRVSAENRHLVAVRANDGDEEQDEGTKDRDGRTIS